MTTKNMLALEQEFDDLKKAEEAATRLAIATFARVLPCVIFSQGNRKLVSTSLPFRSLGNVNIIQLDPVAKTSDEAGDPRTAKNRPLTPEHAKAIRTYLLGNTSKYILPPITLNAKTPVQLYSVKSPTQFRGGFLVINDQSVFTVTDGQHRIAAIRGIPGSKELGTEIFEEDNSFYGDSLGVLIVFETGLEQIHQDFADAAKTKPINSSLLAAYDIRQPINRVVAKVVERSPLLKGRIDEVSNTLAKHNPNVFTLNQIRVFVKLCLVGESGQSEKSVLKFSANNLSLIEQQDQRAEQIIRILEQLSHEMEPWSEIVKFKPKDPKRSIIPRYRERFLNTTGTGLALIGRVAHEILLQDEHRIGPLLQQLATEIDWRREGKIWSQTNLIEIDTEKKSKKITGGRDIFKNTFEALLTELGIQRAKAKAGSEN